MTETSSERRLAENEAVFRKLNEQVSTGIEETNRLAREDNQPEFLIGAPHDNTALQFYCECADENCSQRITLTIADYKSIHENRNQFIIVPGHEALKVEKIVRKQPEYYVVEKSQDPPEQPEKLHPTSVDNA